MKLNMIRDTNNNYNTNGKSLSSKIIINIEADELDAAEYLFTQKLIQQVNEFMMFQRPGDAGFFTRLFAAFKMTFMFNRKSKTEDKIFTKQGWK